MRKFLPLVLIVTIVVFTLILVGKQTSFFNKASEPTDTVITIDNSSKEVTYEGVWNKVKTPLATNGYYSQSKVASSTAQVKIPGGNQFTIESIKWRNAGIANIYIDGNLLETVDLYAPGKEYKFKIGPFSLPPDSDIHTVTIEVTNQKNPKSTDYLVFFDSVLYSKIYTITPTPTPIIDASLTMSPSQTPVPSKLVSYDDKSKELSFMGKWTEAKTSLANGGTYKYSIIPFNKINLTIDGKGFFSVTTVKEKKNGIMNIFVNDQLVESFDTYNTAKLYNIKTPLIDLPNLDKNTISLEVSSQKNPLSNGYLVAFDKIDIAYSPPITSPLPPTPTVSPLPAGLTQKRVQVVIFDPILESQGNKRLSQYLGFKNSQLMTNEIIDALKKASKGQVNYVINETQVLDEFVPYTDGYRYTDSEYLNDYQNGTFDHGDNGKDQPMFDYKKVINDKAWCTKRNSGEIDEVWIWGYPNAGLWESNLAGPGAFWYNSSPTTGTTCQKLLPTMGFNNNVSTDLALHSYGHRIESTMENIFNGWNSVTGFSPFDTFTKKNIDSTGQSRCGNIHFGPNSSTEHDYSNQSTVQSACDDWYEYPNLPSTPNFKATNCSAWGCTQLGFMTWWMSHVPNKDGFLDGKSTNWWRYIVDYENTPK